mmetsp:Transcript_6623/g.7218  ORF Transcript_6623/g.7218 Transcript_6623/m.7218 type:complete len:106 (-) Transcript_6623:1690-2007(-)
MRIHTTYSVDCCLILLQLQRDQRNQCEYQSLPRLNTIQSNIVQPVWDIEILRNSEEKESTKNCTILKLREKVLIIHQKIHQIIFFLFQYPTFFDNGVAGLLISLC